MWTPKRLLLLVAGFVIFFASYEIYAYFLGHYDGLPPLPAEWRATPGPVGPLPDLAVPQSSAVKRLREAFGLNCEEQHRRIKLEWRLQGTVMAADEWQLKEGRLELKNVSVASFGKPKKDAKGIEINTARGDRAEVEFEKPLKDVRDATNAKPIGGKLYTLKENGIQRKVHLQNNASTPSPDDDLHLYTDWLVFRDDQHRIFTEADVRIVDGERATATASGMEVMLIPSENPPAKKPAKGAAAPPKNDAKPTAKPSSSSAKGSKHSKSTFSGVKFVRLTKDVNMHIDIDANDAFLSGGSKANKNKKPGTAMVEMGPPAEEPLASAKKPGDKETRKTPVKIHCDDDFVYTPGETTDVAEFNRGVWVIRTHLAAPAGQPGADPVQHYDQLDCDKLVMLFQRRKVDDKKKPVDDRPEALELISARATGEQVELVSEADVLHVTGNDMLYEKATNRTTLRGNPELHADKDGHQMKLGGTLILQPSQDGKELQEATADGPGEVRMKGDKGAIRLARWSKQLHITKEGIFERLTLTGTASFEEETPEPRRLDAEKIIVWLEQPPVKPSAKPGTPTDKPAANVVKVEKADGVDGKLDTAATPANPGKPIAKAAAPEQKRIPRRMEAYDNITLNSKELRINNATRLRLWIEDLKPTDRAPAQAAGVDAKTGPMNPPRPDEPRVGGRAGEKFLPSTSSSRDKDKDKDAKPKEPIVLSAQSVDVKLTYDDGRSDLKDLHCERDVHVTQKGATPDDRGIEIRGSQMDLVHHWDGNELHVTGQPGYVQLDKISLIGNVVNIDQRDNRAWVDGLGSMKMPSKSDFNGNALKEPRDVIVHWNKSMVFDGKIAEFDGGVVATQDQARLACRNLQVELDRRVSLKEKQANAPGDQPAALNRLIADQDVRGEKGVWDDKLRKWLQFERVEGKEMLVENSNASRSGPRMEVWGPGAVTILQSGGKEENLFGPANKPAGPKPPMPPPAKPGEPQPSEMKLTWIRYEGHMLGSRSAKDTDVVVFNGGVQLINMPADDPNVEINVDLLPPGALYIRCNTLKALNHKRENKADYKEFEATQRVVVRAKEFRANCDVLKYDESKDDLLILEGLGDNVATLYRQRAQGGEYEPTRAKKIWYYRKTGQVEVDGPQIIEIKP